MAASSLGLSRLGRSWDGVPVLAGVDLEVAAGELVAVVGPSGSGKSTLLRLISGLEAPDPGGRVEVGGRDVTDEPPARRDVAMVFQSFALFPHLDVAANVAFGLDARRTPRAERDARVAEVAARLRISELLPRAPATLSGGQRQRVALARGLVGRPGVLLLDEPLSNLDAQLRAEARTEIAALQADAGQTTLHVTHDQSEALALGQRLMVLSDGAVQQVGPPDEVYDRPANAFVAGFLGSPPMALLDARVRDGRVWLGAHDLGPAPGGGGGAGEGGAGDGPVTAGIRPEHVTVRGATDDAGLPARVLTVDLAGHELVCRLDVDGARLATRLPRQAAPRPGERVRAVVDPAGLRLFDAETGARIG